MWNENWLKQIFFFFFFFFSEFIFTGNWKHTCFCYKPEKYLSESRVVSWNSNVGIITYPSSLSTLKTLEHRHTSACQKKYFSLPKWGDCSALQFRLSPLPSAVLKWIRNSPQGSLIERNTLRGCKWSLSKTYEIWIYYRWVVFFQVQIQIFTPLLLLSYVACFIGWQEGGGKELTTCVPIITLTTVLVCLTRSPLLCLLFVFILLDPASTYVCTAELLMRVKLQT